MGSSTTTGIIDSHFHGVIMQEKGIDTAAKISELLNDGLAAGIDVSTTPRDLTERVAIYSPHPAILLSSGIHPGQCGRTDTDQALEVLRSQLSSAELFGHIAALGEMGLDWYRGQDNRKEQIHVFRAQLELALTYDLPVIIHNREADSDIIECLQSFRGVRGIMHCFSSDAAFAERCLDIGLTISFAGNVTYKKSAAIREAATMVPDDRLLLETDSPFLSPQAVRGTTNHPGNVAYTYDFLAGIRGVDLQALIETTQDNFHALFPTARGGADSH